VYVAQALENELKSERLSEVRDRMPEGVAPVLGPITNALGEVYQYTLERTGEADEKHVLTNDELVERRTLQDWVVRPLLRSIPGVAEVNSTGGFVKQYETLVDPQKLHYYNLTVNDVRTALARNNANAGGGILPQQAEQHLIRSVGLVKNLEDIRNIVLKALAGCGPAVWGPVPLVAPGTYQIPVTATDSNGVSQTAILTLSVTARS
jgi:cobalt-zinc-cadmium resistance protein CzcA